ncbi:hypothetical protein JTE90_027844 [Oedothorax gibbosus]|uniref:Uncharacterized protein n=1 Tax=Oedothorax gibbosus TaxID=931172 RepID=A0AAV6U3H6_9ARAC|nr:hypothetical protein JTE90_027844 [Oedothorax gibbosus]
MAKIKRSKNILNCIFLCVLAVLGKVRGEDAERSITFDDILAHSGYDYLRPPQINDTPVFVKLFINELNVRSIDESDMSFSVALEIWQSWFDYRLTFPSWSKNYTRILDSSFNNLIWHPNLYFPNAVKGDLNNIISPSSFFWISQTNQIVFCSRLTLKLICEMNLVNYPHDEQRCGVKMASAVYSERKVRMEWMHTDKLVSQKFSSLQQFEIVRLENKKCHQTLTALNLLSCLEKSILLRRRYGYYLINVYIPTSLIVAMSMLTFWIPPDAVPARVTLGVTSLLTVITKQYQAGMPNVSYVVALNIWLSTCIAFVFFSLLEFATVVALSTKTPSEGDRHEQLLLMESSF